MEPKMIWGNLASDDLKATYEFYTKLGFESNNKYSSDENASFNFGKDKFIINFFKRSKLETDINGAIGKWKTQSEVLFSLSAATREEVDSWREKVLEAGGSVFSEPQNYEQGYTFCFADPDGHKFNVLYWPGM